MSIDDLYDVINLNNLPTRDQGTVITALKRIEHDLKLINRYSEVTIELAPTKPLKPTKESKL